MADLAASTALRDPQAGTPGLLNVPYSTFAGASVARGAAHSDRSFRRFATTWCEKSGLDGLKKLEQFWEQGESQDLKKIADDTVRKVLREEK